MAVLYGKPHYSGARNNEVELYIAIFSIFKIIRQFLNSRVSICVVYDLL